MNGLMLGNCKALWIKVLYKCNPFTCLGQSSRYLNPISKFGFIFIVVLQSADVKKGYGIGQLCQCAEGYRAIMSLIA